MVTTRVTGRQWILLATPVVLTASMCVAFNTLVPRFGYAVGFSLGMIGYMAAWCLVLPAIRERRLPRTGTRDRVATRCGPNRELAGL